MDSEDLKKESDQNKTNLSSRHGTTLHIEGSIPIVEDRKWMVKSLLLWIKPINMSCSLTMCDNEFCMQEKELGRTLTQLRVFCHTH